MDIHYVTEKIIIVSFPESGSNAKYRADLKDVVRGLRAKHGNKYMVFNLSERRHDLSKINSQVLDFGWPSQLAPPLERLCSLCKAIDSWLMSDPHHVAVLHSKGDKGRLGVILAAYMHYSNICASAEQDLDRFTMKRFYEDHLSSFVYPSQKRYVHYFAGLLSGAIRMNNNTLYLHHVIIHGIPNFDNKGGCRPFIKIYQGMAPVYTSGVYSVSDRARRIIIAVNPSLQLRGDILIKCYHKRQHPPQRSTIFKIQFHTCTLNRENLVFLKNEIDNASTDSRVPEDLRVEFQFSYHPEDFRGNGSVSDAVVPQDIAHDPIVKWDSYENFDLVPEDKLDDLDADFLNLSTNPERPEARYSSPTRGVLHGENEFHRKSAYPNSNQSARDSFRNEHAQLDELLDGMLREIQSIPDPYPTRTLSPSVSSPRSYQNTFSTITTLPRSEYSPRSASQMYTPVMGMVSVNGTKQPLNNGIIYTRTGPAWSSDDPDCDTPYHTRKNVAPFSYGIHSESPAIQRRRTQSESETAPTLGQRHQDNSPITDGVRGLSLSPEPPRYSFSQGGSASWLQRQQEKLKARKEGRGWEDRIQREQQLLAELRQAQAKPQHNGEVFPNDAPPSSSSREASPSKANYSTPLHINTYNGHVTPPLPPAAPSPCYTTAKPPIGRGISAPSSPLIPSRSSSRDVTKTRYPQWQSHSRPLVRQKSDTSHDRERPFMATKRVHEQAQEQLAANATTPHQVIGSIYGTTYPYSHDKTGPLSIETSSPTKTHPRTGADDASGLLAVLEEKQKGPSPDPPSSSPGSGKLGDLDHSLQVLSMSSHSPTQSSKMPTNSTPNKPGLEKEGPPSWAPSAVSSASPPGSPTRMGDRPPTPAFPVSPRTPYANQESPLSSAVPPRSPVLSRKDRSPSPGTVQTLRQGLAGQMTSPGSTSANGQSSPSVYFGQSRRASMLSLNEPEVITNHPLFVKDTSKYWYKPNISREDAINMLKDKPPGTFVVRDSNSFPGAFGLALKVATPPPNTQNKTGDISNELVRHFLIEPTSKGVRLKGCPNEPVFVSLSALVYQHSITPLALPCKLLLPESDPAEGENGGENQDMADGIIARNSLLDQGAACSLLYLNSVDTELLTGPQAVRRAVTETLNAKLLPQPTAVHFKVSTQGITLTDNNRKVFFRRHYPLNTISHCGLDPEDRKWTRINEDTGLPISTSRCFGFVARKSATQMDNLCHVFAELEPEQPASAIVNFVNKVLLTMNPDNQKMSFI